MHDRFTPATSSSNRKARSTNHSHHATGAASDSWSRPGELELRVPPVREMPIEFNSASTVADKDAEKDANAFNAHIFAV